MKLLYTNQSIALVHQLQSWLSSFEIPSEIRNEHIGTLRGLIGPTELWPELWVAVSEFAAAQEALAQWQKPETADSLSWLCPSCGESCESQFTECWSCGASGT